MGGVYRDCKEYCAQTPVGAGKEGHPRSTAAVGLAGRQLPQKAQSSICLRAETPTTVELRYADHSTVETR